MTATLAPLPIFRAFTANGAPLAGGLLYTYAAGTTTPLATYTDQSGVTPNANPVVLDANGQANVWLKSGLTYKINLTDASLVQQTGWPVDNIAADQGVAIFAALADTTSAANGDALIGVKNVATGGAPRTQHLKNADTVSDTDFGAVGGGVTDDTTALTYAGATGKTVVLTQTSYKITSWIPGVFKSRRNVTFNGGGYLHLEVDAKMPWDHTVITPASLVGMTSGATSLVILGDSITAGTGASNFQKSWGYRFCRSLWNAIDNQQLGRRSYGYQTTFNAASLLAEPGITSTGTVSATGMVQSRITLAAGQALTLTNQDLTYLDVIYDGATSTGSLVFARNGSTVATKAVSGAVINSTFPTLMPKDGLASSLTMMTDTLTITASGGTINILGLLRFRTNYGGSSPMIYMGGMSGTAYQDYANSAAYTELAYYLNLFSPSNKVMMFMLGTNNIYSAGKTLSPSAMITQIQTVIAGVAALAPGAFYVLSIPPKATGAWPVINGSFLYEDYVDAVLSFAHANNYNVIRNDLAELSQGQHYSDGLHPDDTGHLMMAQTVCEHFGIKPNEFVRYQVAAGLDYNTADVTMNGTWRAYINSTPLRGMASRVQPNTVVLSGICEPNGSVSTTLGTLPAAMWPDRTIYLAGRSDAGAASLSINTSGQIILGAVPTTWFSLEGITFTATRPA